MTNGLVFTNGKGITIIRPQDIICVYTETTTQTVKDGIFGKKTVSQTRITVETENWEFEIDDTPENVAILKGWATSEIVREAKADGAGHG